MPRKTRKKKQIKTKKEMARVKLPAGIAAISGKVGNVCFKTMKKTGKVYMYPLKEQSDKVPSTKEVSEAVKTQQQRFTALAEIVRQMRKAGTRKTQRELWKIATKAYDAANK